ncbi:MAG: ABC transporter transmembrane domain-containing protein, partial [Caulobacterales bacterium]
MTGLALRVARIYLAPRWKAVVVAAICAIGVAATSAWLLLLLRPAVNNTMGHSDGRVSLITLGAILAGVVLARGAAAVLQAWIVNRMGHGVVGDIQRQLVGKLMRADLARLRATHTGGFVSQVLYDAGVIREAATTGLLNYLQQGLQLVATLVVMLVMDWMLTLVVLVAGPIVGWVLRDYSKRTTKAAKGAMEESSALTAAILESLDGVRVVKMENREAAEEARVGQVIARRQKHIIAGADARATAAPVSETLGMLMVAAVFAYAGWRMHMGPMHLGPIPIAPITPGSFAAFVAALMTAGQSLR